MGSDRDLSHVAPRAKPSISARLKLSLLLPSGHGKPGLYVPDCACYYLTLAPPYEVGTCPHYILSLFKEAEVSR
jgi:hypothetical protein